MSAVALRPATSADAALLYSWRNDPETLKFSFQSEPVPWDEHVRWLESSLRDPRRRLLIACVAGSPIGSIRADFADDIWLLSWTIAAPVRRRGFGRSMLAAMLRETPGRVRAKIRHGNPGSIRMVQALGFKQASESGEFSTWEKDAGR